MSANVGYATLQIIPSARGFSAALNKETAGPMAASGKEGGKAFGGGMLGAMKGLAGPLLATLGTAKVIGFLRDSVTAASDTAESASKVGVVFGKSQDRILKASETSATAMGLSKRAYLDSAGTLGNLLVALDVAPKKAAGMSANMVKLAGDMASFNNASPEETLHAISSGLAGETESLKRFGVNINVATVKAQALAMGLVKPTVETAKLEAAQRKQSIAQANANKVLAEHGPKTLEGMRAMDALARANEAVGKAMKGTTPELTSQQKALATSAVIMNQTKTAHGDFERTSKGLANQQRILAAQIDDVKGKVGNALLPVITKAVSYVNASVIPAFRQMGAVFEQVNGFVHSNMGTIRALAVVLGALVVVTQAHRLALALQSGALKAYFLQTKVVQAATKTWAAIQWVLNAAMSANPIALVVIGIAALVAAIVIAYKKSETFRNVLDGVWKALKTGAGDAVGFLIDGFHMLLTYWLTVADGIVSGAAKALGWIPGLGPKLKKANAAFDRMRAGIDSTMDGLASAARGWGEDAMAGLNAGLVAKSGAPIATARGIANKVNAAARAGFDSHSPSRVFISIGNDVMDGLALGIKAGGPGAVSAMNDLTSKIKSLVEDKKISKAAGKAWIDAIDGQTKALRVKAKEREGVVARLEKARDALKSVIDDRNSLSASTTSSALAFGSVTNIGPDTGKVDAAASARDAAQSKLDSLLSDEAASRDDVTKAKDDLAAATANLNAVEAAEALTGENVNRKLGERLAALQTFQGEIDGLRARGLNEATLQEIIGQGADAGAAMAAALSTSTDAQLATLNATTDAVVATAKSLGTTTGQAMYGAGVETAQGIVKGIESELANVDKAAGRIAHRIIRRVRKELGIHSPSKVMAALGGHTIDGFAKGLDDGAPIAERAMSRAVAPPAAPDLSAALAGQEAARAARTQPVVLTLDGRVVAETVFEYGGRDYGYGRKEF